jgi:Peptidase family M23
MKRVVALLPVLVALQVGVQPALAWAWPVDGPVLRPFVLGEDPYAAGQHRGIDVGAPLGATVRAPVAGVVSFAGRVPGGGLTVTIQTADGYSVTLLHLGSIALARETAVAEGQVLGAIGRTGTPEHAQAYVHLGVRLTGDAHAYLDPLSFLPGSAAEPPPAAAPGPPPVEQASPKTGREERPAAAPQAAAKPAAGEAEGAEAPTAAVGSAAEGPGSEPATALTRAAESAAAPRPLGRTKARDSRGPAGARSAHRFPSAHASRPTDGLNGSRAGNRWPGRAAARLGASRPPRMHHAPRELHLLVAPPRRTRPAQQDADRGSSLAWVGSAASLGLLLGAAAALGVRRRQLLDAAVADRPATVLRDRARPPAENTALSRPAEEDGVVLDRDLERILLGQAKSLPNLDRNHDPAELVQMANDPRLSHPSVRAHVRAHRSNPPCRLRRSVLGSGDVMPARSRRFPGASIRKPDDGRLSGASV